VIAMIYEARPNVTVDATGLCLKSGNAVVLRGGKEAVDTNTLLVQVIKEALVQRWPSRVLCSICGDHRPFGDSGFGAAGSVRGSRDPAGGRGNGERHPRHGHGSRVVPWEGPLCAVFIDQDADPAMAEKIILNAKTQRPGVCNAMETLLVHRGIAAAFVPRIVRRLTENRRHASRGSGMPKAGRGRRWSRPKPLDFDTEFLDLELAMKVVGSVEDAIVHVNTHGSHHSDAIVTSNEATARKFLAGVDSAAVFHNASTRFHDGGELGLGSEMGISTQKLHARGSMGLRELTTTKYLVRGFGQTRE
jgi:glutamate-5-semialdehyde dehydrogenase